MKLYEVPTYTWVRISQTGELIHFHHIDHGMYSFCKDEHGNVIRLAAWTEVEIDEQKGDMLNAPI